MLLFKKSSPHDGLWKFLGELTGSDLFFQSQTVNLLNQKLTESFVIEFTNLRNHSFDNFRKFLDYIVIKKVTSVFCLVVL